MSALALNGGEAELARWGGLPHWPRVRDGAEEALLGVLRSGTWGTPQASGCSLSAGVRATRVPMRDCAGKRTLAIGRIVPAEWVGREVIVPPYTFIATSCAPLLVGAVPVFADVDPDSHLMDPEAVRSVITPRTRAPSPFTWGSCADMDTFRQIAAEHDLRVIEDCARRSGCYKSAGVGTLGDVAPSVSSPRRT